MAGQSTVLSADGGQVSVPSSGLWTATGIQQVQSLLFANNVVEVAYGQNGAPPAPAIPAGSTGTYMLEVANGMSAGSLAIPDGYGAVIFGQGSSGTVTGGNATTMVLSAGSIDYSGNAGMVDQTSTVPGTTGTFVDNAAGAMFDLGGGSYRLTAGGAQQTIRVDEGAQTAIVASGDGDSITLGDPAGSNSSVTGVFNNARVLGAEAAGVVAGNNIRITGRGDAITVNSFGNIIGDGGAGSTTISGVTGSSTIFAANNDVYFGAAAVTEFISGAGSQTVFGGTGNDTVFNSAGGNVVYNEGSGSNNIFVDGAGGNSTINGAGAGAVFGGSGHINLVLGNGNDVFVGGTGGSDSIYGGSVTPTIFGGSSETMQVVGSHASFIVADGTNSTLSGALTNGGDNFFASSAVGNTTLVGSTGSGAESFNLDSVSGGTAHTITIENFHTGDALFLNGYNTADIQTMDTAIVGAKSSFTLSDGTTVTFQGAQPTHASGSAIF